MIVGPLSQGEVAVFLFALWPINNQGSNDTELKQKLVNHQIVFFTKLKKNSYNQLFFLLNNFNYIIGGTKNGSDEFLDLGAW